MVVAKIRSSVVKVIVDAVSEIVDAVVVDFGEEGVRMQAMDASHVSLCCLRLDRSAFSEYACDEPRSAGVSLSILSRIFRCASSEDELEVRVDDGSDRMSLRFKGPARSSEFEMRLMEIDTERLQIPRVEYECVVSMPSPELQRVVRDVAVVGETCAVDVKDGRIVFSSDGDMGRASFEPLDASVLGVEGAVRSRFAVKYLQMFTKATPLCKKAVLRMSRDNPMCLEYEIGGAGVLRYYLAPKMDDDDDDDGGGGGGDMS